MAKRRADRAARADTFELVANEWLELQRKALAPETMEILSRRLKSFLYPFIGGASGWGYHGAGTAGGAAED